MSPSSPVSAGMLPSNRTLVVGCVQVVIPPPVVTQEQFPVADDPFTDIVSAVEREKLDGITTFRWVDQRQVQI